MHPLPRRRIWARAAALASTPGSRAASCPGAPALPRASVRLVLAHRPSLSCRRFRTNGFDPGLGRAHRTEVATRGSDEMGACGQAFPARTLFSDDAAAAACSAPLLFGAILDGYRGAGPASVFA